MGSDELRLDSERVFWDHHVPALDRCLEEYRQGPDPNTAALIDALEPLTGRSVLDFACGAGVMSAWLVARGADVTGVDLSDGAVERAEELFEALGLDATFVAEDVAVLASNETKRFDRITGRYALHHVDPQVIAPLLGRCLASDGKAAFVETMVTNPILRLARKHSVGKLGVPRLGTLDEQPLTQDDVAFLAEVFGASNVQVAELAFFRIFDRQLFRYRSPRASRILGGVDDFLGRWDSLRFLSYKQVLIFERRE
ncbi:MAG: class I SAM-dependent methyltransferase [Acidimicrobiales bacterium]